MVTWSIRDSHLLVCRSISTWMVHLVFPLFPVKCRGSLSLFSYLERLYKNSLLACVKQLYTNKFDEYVQF